MVNYDWFGDFMAGDCVHIKEKDEPYFVGSTNEPEAATGTSKNQLCIHQLKKKEQNLLLQPQWPQWLSLHQHPPAKGRALPGAKGSASDSKNKILLHGKSLWRWKTSSTLTIHSVPLNPSGPFQCLQESATGLWCILGRLFWRSRPGEAPWCRFSSTQVSLGCRKREMQEMSQEPPVLTHCCWGRSSALHNSLEMTWGAVFLARIGVLRMLPHKSHAMECPGRRISRLISLTKLPVFSFPINTQTEEHSPVCSHFFSFFFFCSITAFLLFFS